MASCASTRWKMNSLWQYFKICSYKSIWRISPYSLPPRSPDRTQFASNRMMSSVQSGPTRCQMCQRWQKKQRRQQKSIRDELTVNGNGNGKWKMQYSLRFHSNQFVQRAANCQSAICRQSMHLAKQLANS